MSVEIVTTNYQQQQIMAHLFVAFINLSQSITPIQAGGH